MKLNNAHLDLALLYILRLSICYGNNCIFLGLLTLALAFNAHFLNTLDNYRLINEEHEKDTKGPLKIRDLPIAIVGGLLINRLFSYSKSLQIEI